MRMIPPSINIRKVMIGFAVIVALTFIGLGSYTGYLYFKANAALNKIAAPNPEPQPQHNDDAVDKPIEPEKPKPITFLLVGVDNREGSGGTMNTDVIMFTSFDPVTKKATLVSLPRDVELKPEQLGSHKANYFYAYYYNKDKNTAIANTKQFYSELFDFPIDYMVVIDFVGLQELVDALGGLEVDVDMDMRYVDQADGTNINLRKGLQKLDGKQVLDFVRYRKSNRGTQESSDLARNERQQQVLDKMMAKMTTLNGISQWGKVLEIIGDRVKTDIPYTVLRGWITDYKSMKPDGIDFESLNGRWESPYIVVDEADFNRAFGALRATAGLPPEMKVRAAEIMEVSGD